MKIYAIRDDLKADFGYYIKQATANEKCHILKKAYKRMARAEQMLLDADEDPDEELAPYDIETRVEMTLARIDFLSVEEKEQLMKGIWTYGGIPEVVEIDVIEE